MNGRGRDALLILLEAAATLVVAYGALRMQGTDPLKDVQRWLAMHQPPGVNQGVLEHWRKRYELGVVGGEDDGVV